MNGPVACPLAASGAVGSATVVPPEVAPAAAGNCAFGGGGGCVGEVSRYSNNAWIVESSVGGGPLLGGAG